MLQIGRAPSRAQGAVRSSRLVRNPLTVGRAPFWQGPPSTAAHALAGDSSMRRSKQGDSFIETAIRQELGMQSTRLPDDVRERVETAIQRQRYTTTVGEVAAQAGLKLSEAEEALKALAYDSQAVLQVSSEGDVVYAFSDDFKSAIRNKSFTLQAKPVLAKAQTALAFLVRVTFGTALFVSIVATFLAITVLLNSRSSNDDRRSGSSSSFGGGMAFRMMDLWWLWNPSYSRQDSGREDEEMSLPEAVFSFVFGDGDPNKGYDETRWRALGRAIQNRDGVMTAEEMAPYLDSTSTGKAAGSGDEGYVLPALIKFGGEPFVDEEGHLLYRFPSLQKKVLQREILGPRSLTLQQLGDDASSPQYEEPWDLTAASPGQLVAIVGLGILNIVGVATLSNLLVDPYSSAYLASQGLGWVASALPGLVVYAASFFGIPAFRFFRNLSRNKEIAERNEAREQAALQLASPSRQLAEKLASARKLGDQKLITKSDIVFTTEQDAGQQLNAREMSDWDRKLGSKQESAEGGSAGW